MLQWDGAVEYDALYVRSGAHAIDEKQALVSYDEFDE